MFATLTTLFGWAAAIGLIYVTFLLARNSDAGLKYIQHRADMLPQAMLVRYGGMSLLAVLAVWFNAPRMLFAILLSFAVIGLGDAFIYRRAGHPFWMHLAVGIVTGLGAVIALISIP
ncbi:MAG: hypothetical protein AAGB28_18790 [Pseudomonadota bacterium]